MKLIEKVQRRFTKIWRENHMKKHYTVLSYGHSKTEEISKISSRF